jgi:hypothetical protein
MAVICNAGILIFNKEKNMKSTILKQVCLITLFFFMAGSLTSLCGFSLKRSYSEGDLSTLAQAATEGTQTAEAQAPFLSNILSSIMNIFSSDETSEEMNLIAKLRQALQDSKKTKVKVAIAGLVAITYGVDQIFNGGALTTTFLAGAGKAARGTLRTGQKVVAGTKKKLLRKKEVSEQKAQEGQTLSEEDLAKALEIILQGLEEMSEEEILEEIKDLEKEEVVEVEI